MTKIKAIGYLIVGIWQDLRQYLGSGWEYACYRANGNQWPDGRADV